MPPASEIVWQTELALPGSVHRAQLLPRLHGGVLALMQQRPDFFKPPAQSIVADLDTHGAVRWQVSVFAGSREAISAKANATMLVLFQVQDLVAGTARLQAYRLSDGALLWQQSLTGLQFPSGSEATPLELTSDGQILLPVQRGGAFQVLRFDRDGLPLSSLHWASSPQTQFRSWAIRQLPDQSVVLALERFTPFSSGSLLLHFDALGATSTVHDLKMAQLRALELAVQDQQLYLAAIHRTVGIDALLLNQFSLPLRQRWRREAQIFLGSFFLHGLAVQPDSATLYFSIDDAPRFLGSTLLSFSAAGEAHHLRMVTKQADNWFGHGLSQDLQQNLLTTNFADISSFELVQWRQGHTACSRSALSSPNGEPLQPLASAPALGGGWFVAAVRGAGNTASIVLWKLALTANCDALFHSGMDEADYFSP